MEKRFPPSKKRIKESRRNGNFPRSQQLTQAGVLFAGCLAIAFARTFAWVDIRLLLEYLFTEGLRDPGEATRRCFLEALKVVVGVLGFGALVGVVLEVSQIGLFFEPYLASPQIERVNFFRGLRRIFESLKQVPLILLRFTSLAVISIFLLYSLCSRCGPVIFTSWEQQSGFVLAELYTASAAVFPLLFAFAAFEYFMRRRSWFESVAMSLDDLRREQKEEEGDPHVRSFRRAAHRELSIQDIIRRVKNSRVIIVAPRGKEV